jgi:hypothetical protein
VDRKQNGPEAFADAPGQTKTNCAFNSTRPPAKWKRVLSAFYEGASYNRFEAERLLHDHCLHSTVSTIQRKGVTILRKTETIPGFQGIPTEVCRYWLSPESREQADALLSGDGGVE